MAKELSTEVKTDSELIERPDFIGGMTTGENATGMPAGLENIDPYDQPLYGKIIQSLSGEPFKPTFDDGDYVVTPDNRLIVEKGEVFHFTPIFAYTEYICRNPVLNVPGLEFIREKTRDPDSECAQRALSRDKEVNTLPCPEDPEFNIEYLKAVNYIILLHDHDENVGQTPIVHAFIKGEAKYGEGFKRLLKARKVDAIYKCRFQASTSLHTGKGARKWFGMDILNPEDGNPWITESQLAMFEEIYKNCSVAFKEGGLNVDYSQGMDENTVDAVSSEEKKF